MKKCRKCHRQDPTLLIGSKSGLCIDCLEKIYICATPLLEQIVKGGQERINALAQIDNSTAAEVAEHAMAASGNSPFAVWDVSIHSTGDQLSRIRRSSSIKIISYDPNTQTATIGGSGKTSYTTSFEMCSCGDFISRRLPCKHMYRLAAVHGGIDFSKYLK